MNRLKAKCQLENIEIKNIATLTKEIVNSDSYKKVEQEIMQKMKNGKFRF
jgi:hypothetical protein